MRRQSVFSRLLHIVVAVQVALGPSLVLAATGSTRTPHVEALAVGELQWAIRNVALHPSAETALKGLRGHLRRVKRQLDAGEFQATPQLNQAVEKARLTLNVAEIKEQLERCLGADRDSPYKDFVVAGACLAAQTFPAGVINLHRDFVRVKAAVEREDFAQKIYRQVLSNASSHYLKLKHRFGDQLLQGSKAQLVEAFCRRCDADTKAFLQDRMERQRRELLRRERRDRIQTFNFTQAADRLRSEVAELNRQLATLRREVDEEGRVVRAPSLDQEREARQAYRRLVQSDLLRVFPPQHIQRMIGRERQPRGSRWRTETALFSKRQVKTLRPYRSPSVSSLLGFKLAAEREIVSGVENLSDVAQSPSALEKLKTMIHTNPQAAGQVLASHPEYTQFLCQAILQIEQERREDQETRDMVFTWGVPVIGALGLLSGGLLWAGFAVGGSLVGAVSVGAGFAVSGYQGYQYYREFSEQPLIRLGCTEVTSASCRRAQRKEHELKRAQLDFVASVGTSMGLFGVLKGAALAAGAGRGLLNQPLAEKIYERVIRLSEKIKRRRPLAQRIKRVRQGYPAEDERVETFLGYLSQAREDLQDKVLSLLLRGEMSAVRKMINKMTKKDRSCR